MRRRISTKLGIALPLILAAVSSQASAGNAKATVVVDGKTYVYTGGACTRSGGMFAVNIGTMPSEAKPGTKPDYFGMTIMSGPGAFTNAGVSFNKDGVRRSTGTASGTSTASGATFTGKLMRGGEVAKGTFSC